MLAYGRMVRCLLALILVFAAALPAWAQRAPDLTLTGHITRAQHETYVEVPFKVPARVERLTVRFDYTGKDQRAVIDLGLRDPVRLRGWSGGNKATFTLAEGDATPSYLPGPLPAGAWKLVLGVPNIRKNATADYTARIWFDHKGAPPSTFADSTTLSIGERWWRGDLHMHTGHSDGTCLSRKGAKVPCPVFKTLDTAVARGLDFIAVTDHNTTSPFDALRELAPYYDDLLVIPGREVTTFHGHANVFGPTGPIDFQLGSPRAPKLGVILDQAERAGGLVAINHPGLPSGEACMGCGWTVGDTDFTRIPAIEVINGGLTQGPLSGIPFWEAQLDAGHRITAVGGSDNHDPTLAPAKAPAIGVPTTVVKSMELSPAAILAAIRAGHVFVDVDGSRDRLLEVTAVLGDTRAGMGDAIAAPAGSRVQLSVRTHGVEGAVITLAGDAAVLVTLSNPTIEKVDDLRAFELVSDGARRWLRVDVRSTSGRLLLLGNPIYLNPRN